MFVQLEDKWAVGMMSSKVASYVVQKNEMR